MERIDSVKQGYENFYFNMIIEKDDSLDSIVEKINNLIKKQGFIFNRRIEVRDLCFYSQNSTKFCYLSQKPWGYDLYPININEIKSDNYHKLCEEHKKRVKQFLNKDSAIKHEIKYTKKMIEMYEKNIHKYKERLKLLESKQ